MQTNIVNYAQIALERIIREHNIDYSYPKMNIPTAELVQLLVIERYKFLAKYSITGVVEIYDMLIADLPKIPSNEINRFNFITAPQSEPLEPIYIEKPFNYYRPNDHLVDINKIQFSRGWPMK